MRPRFVGSGPSILIADSAADEILRWSLTTGVAEVVASNTVGTGHVFQSPTHLDYDFYEDRLYVSDEDSTDSVLAAADLATGNRTIVSSRFVGSGPPNGYSRGVRAFQPDPAPSVPGLGLVGAGAALTASMLAGLRRLNRAHGAA